MKTLFQHPLIQFFHSTIKGKLMLTAGLVLVGFISMTIFFSLAMNHLTVTQALHSNIEMLNSELLLLRRNEKDFMARKDMKYVERFTANKKKMRASIDEDLSLMSEIGLETGIINAFHEEVDSYTNTFTDYVNQQVIIGLNQKSGLHGKLRESVHLAEKRVKTVSNYQLLANILMLRRNEKDFLQRKDLKYQDKFLKNYKILMTNLNNSSLTNKQKQNIRQPLEVYKNDFLAVIKSYTIIGLTPKSGIHGELRDSVHTAEDTLEYAISGIKGVIEDQEAQTKLTLGGIIIVFCSALLLFITLIIRSILKPISELIESIKTITQTCNFSHRSEITNKGEIGEISRQLNQFFSTLQINIDQVNQQMNAIASGDFEQRITQTFTGDLELLRQSTNESSDSIMKTMEALNDVMHSLSEGDFKARMNEDTEDAFRQTVDNAMQSIDIALTEIIQVMSHVSSGDFSQRITTQYKGDLLNLKNSINQSLENLEAAMSEITSIAISQKDGNLNKQVNGQYQGQLLTLKEAINTSASNLNQVISNINEANHSIYNINQEISSGNNNLSTRTQQQSSELDGITRSLATLTDAAEHNVSSAQQATTMSINAKSLAEKGGAVISETTLAMTEITQSSKNIAEIITVINEIAFQTNLLALNASVEAARAGEQGRGFAVVATEVRNLAQRSASAAKEIEELISDSVTKVANGEELIHNSSLILNDIVIAVNNVSDINAEISSSSQEQLRSTSEVTTTITQLDTITQQNAALAEEMSASSVASIDNVQKMAEIIKFFSTKQAV